MIYMTQVSNVFISLVTHSFGQRRFIGVGATSQMKVSTGGYVMSNQMTDQSETKEYVVKIRDAFLCIIFWEVAWYASLVLKKWYASLVLKKYCNLDRNIR